MANPVPIGILTISDRAANGIYDDESGPAVKKWLQGKDAFPIKIFTKIVPDEKNTIKEVLEEWVNKGFGLIITTGGTGPSERDVTPEATKEICTKELPGFSEKMRLASIQDVPTAILSRQITAIAKKTLIINLPGSPKSIDVCLNAVQESIAPAINLIGLHKINLKLILNEDKNTCLH
tara:strand:- start:168 stop:701 length:534 start_codon:yes stop_codon:yes gene_type:complete